MTNEDAVRMIQNDMRLHHDSLSGEYRQALNMAIKALTQQPCEDCVSRNAISQTLNTMYRYVADELTLCDTDEKFPKNEVFIVDEVYEEIVEQLSSVTPQSNTGHWVKITPYPLQMHDYECSECGHETDDNTENYCSGCGARMIEPQESEKKNDSRKSN